MISGVVKDRHAIVPVVFHLPNRPDFSIDFVIDTGFTEHLSPPSEAVSLLGLPFKCAMSANLADHSNVILPVHEAVILWNGVERNVSVLATGKKPCYLVVVRLEVLTFFLTPTGAFDPSSFCLTSRK
jgi:clan AA aspartic protease